MNYKKRILNERSALDALSGAWHWQGLMAGAALGSMLARGAYEHLLGLDPTSTLGGIAQAAGAIGGFVGTDKLYNTIHPDPLVRGENFQKKFPVGSKVKFKHPYYNKEMTGTVTRHSKDISGDEIVHNTSVVPDGMKAPVKVRSSGLYENVIILESLEKEINKFLKESKQINENNSVYNALHRLYVIPQVTGLGSGLAAGAGAIAGHIGASSLGISPELGAGLGGLAGLFGGGYATYNAIKGSVKRTLKRGKSKQDKFPVGSTVNLPIRGRVIQHHTKHEESMFGIARNQYDQNYKTIIQPENSSEHIEVNSHELKESLNWLKKKKNQR